MLRPVIDPDPSATEGLTEQQWVRLLLLLTTRARRLPREPTVAVPGRFILGLGEGSETWPPKG